MANIIITLIRDEGNFVVDFVLYHLNAGFDKIVIFDDRSITPIAELLSILPDELKHKVDCHRLSSDFYEWTTDVDEIYFDPALFTHFSNSKQTYFCNLGLARFAEPTDWVAFIDADEFLWLGGYGSISRLRAAMHDHGFCAMIFPMLLYGHGFHIVPPADNNICAFLWRAKNLYGHGKFYAQAGAIRVVNNIHFPTLYSPALACGTTLRPRKTEFDADSSAIKDMSIPHIKHYIVQDVSTCFKRRLRGRISQRSPVSATTPAWLDRIEMLRWSSSIVDPSMAAFMISARAQAGLDISEHARALSTGLESVPQNKRMGSAIDFGFLRGVMGSEPSESDASLLFRFFTQETPDWAMLRFISLPDGFDAYRYRALYRDLTSLDLPERELEQHYLNYGYQEGRNFK